MFLKPCPPYENICPFPKGKTNPYKLRNFFTMKKNNVAKNFNFFSFFPPEIFIVTTSSVKKDKNSRK